MLKIFQYAFLIVVALNFTNCKKKSAEANAEGSANDTTTAVSQPEPAKELMTESGMKVPFEIKDSTKIVTLPSKLRYYIVEEGTGNKPQTGDLVVAHYHGLLADGKKFDSSFERGEAFSFTIGKGQVIKGWDEGFAQFKEGTKAVLIVPPDLGYGATGAGPIPPNSTLYFHVELRKAVNPKKLTKPPFEIKDPSKIVTTPSGLQYYIVKEGTGPVPQTGKTILAGYHGLLKDKTVFDSSYDRGELFVTPIGIGKVIKGWDEAFTTFKVGTQAVLIIPPNLGYGENAQGKIPPNATLTFHVELVDVL